MKDTTPFKVAAVVSIGLWTPFLYIYFLIFCVVLCLLPCFILRADGRLQLLYGEVLHLLVAPI